MSDVRFIRVNGRVVPIRNRNSNESVSKRYGKDGLKSTKPKSIGVINGAKIGASTGFSIYGISELNRISSQSKSMINSIKSGIPTIGNVQLKGFRNFLKGGIKPTLIGVS